MVAWPRRDFRLRASDLRLVENSAWVLPREFGTRAVGDILPSYGCSGGRHPFYPQGADGSLR